MNNAAINLNAAADEQGVSRSEVLEFIEQRAKREITGNISTVDAATADARLLGGELPASLRPRPDIRHAPPDASTIDRADDVLAAYTTGKKKGQTYSKDDMEFVRAAWRVKKAARAPASPKKRGRPKLHREFIQS